MEQLSEVESTASSFVTQAHVYGTLNNRNDSTLRHIKCSFSCFGEDMHVAPYPDIKQGSVGPFLTSEIQ